ncbi:MAG: 30S ribosomal protein S12 methylthiotransferase RimO [Candidatus Omnitrophica bacterium]|nr:30S ribosomal protein S12 methylthiotransferase RimO [Candidatus Omnitrophota bacterium]MBL7151254.1 30S ribosomal protein S12 methylthiotransferase RimO [Candidatus Omnitrophota bacterium]
MKDKAKTSVGPSASLRTNNIIKKNTIGILSLGCPRNLVDSETILGRLSSKGYSIAENISAAEIGIVNTCAFIEEARRESIDAILDLVELKKEGRLKKIIVCGCLPQRYKSRLKKELPEVDAFMGKLSLNHQSWRFPITPRHYAYLKICEGCINQCSFCVIPKIKGRLCSLDMDAVISQVKKFNAHEGFSEINIIGQDTSGYGMDLYTRPKLSTLLKEVLKNSPAINWVRLLYLYPGRVTDDLLKLIRDSSRVCRYIDLPIQHINDRILKLMNRNTTRKEIAALVEKIRKFIPGVFLRSSVITGFPSETEKEFKELLDFLREVKFERLGAFSYSREEGTAAYDFKGHLPQELKIERLNRIMSMQQKISQEVNNRFLGRVIDVLIDEQEGDAYLGRSEYDAPEVDGSVFVRSKKRLKPGDFVKVKITDTLEYDLAGEAVE